MNEKYIATTYNSFSRGVTPLLRGAGAEFKVIGYDTETAEGHIYLSGLYSERGYVSCYGLGSDHVAFLVDEALKHSEKHRRPVAVFVHNLAFDFGSLLFRLLLSSDRGAAPKESIFSHLQTKTTWTVSWTRPCFAKIRRGHSSIHVIDTLAYFKRSLAQALIDIDAPVRKLEAPKDFDKGMIPRKEIEPYHKRDCEGVYWLGKKIVSYWQAYDVRPCVSIPHMAGSIFRRRFLTAPFVKTSKLIDRVSMLSYHGGKNRFLGSPGWRTNVYELDINSAYPEAMAQLPDFSRGRFKWVHRFVSTLGVYCVSGHVSRCRYGCIHSHDFKPLQGKIKRVWITGYELDEALVSGEFIPERIYGVVFEPDPGPSPFREFVEHFFRLKCEAKTKSEAEEPKLILNSAYGKFVARRFNPEKGQPRIAGSMFYPFIGTLITGFVNAKIHRLEHKYNSFHTATDSIKTIFKPDPQDIGKELGKLKLEIFGDCLMLRNKLYVHKGYDGKIKVGLHGYQGDHAQLLQMWKNQKFDYVKIKLAKWAESWRLGIQPGCAIERQMELLIERSSEK